MGNWEKFDGTTLPPKESFYCKLNLEGISDADYEHAQKVWELFWIKNRGEYHDLNAKSDILLLADVFENFRNMCLEIYELDPVYFCVCTRISMAILLEKDRSKIRSKNRLWHAIDGWKGD